MLKSERKLIDWLIRQKNVLLFLVVTCFAILARLDGLDFVSGDMQGFLLPWAEQFRAQSGFTAMRSQIGDYNILYQTIIILLTRLPGNMVHLYKYVSILFDFLLALACASLLQKGRREPLFGPIFNMTYAIVLLLPTIVLNSAVWGQCDSMYAFLCILALSTLYSRRYVPSFIVLGLAFALKLQTVFILPVYLYIYICRKDFSLLHFLITILTLWATGIPAYLQGRSLTTVLEIYLLQMHDRYGHEYAQCLEPFSPFLRKYAYLCHRPDRAAPGVLFVPFSQPPADHPGKSGKLSDRRSLVCLDLLLHSARHARALQLFV